jgi:hypothetical protein
MYAVLGRWLMDPAQQEQQERVLHEQLVPMVKQAPGFVSAYWGRDVGGPESVSFVVFDDRASAEAFVAMVSSDPTDRGSQGVEPSGQLTMVEIEATA